MLENLAMHKEMLYQLFYSFDQSEAVDKKKSQRTIASWYTIRKTLHTLFNKDYRLSAGELSNEKGNKVHGYVGDKSMK